MTAVNVFMQLTQDLSHDFIREGWLYKTGPRAGDAFRRRWFTLDNRRLMYFEDPMVRTAAHYMKHCHDFPSVL